MLIIILQHTGARSAHPAAEAAYTVPDSFRIPDYFVGIPAEAAEPGVILLLRQIMNDQSHLLFLPIEE
ncbi:hypothetical protein D3C76_1241040 [compost metagenome]